MTFVVALVTAVAVYLVIAGGTRELLADRLGRYLMPTEVEPEVVEQQRVAIPWLASVVTGGLIGSLAAQGDLFLSGTGRSVPALTALGAVAGYFVWSARRTNAQQRRARRLRFELPIIADAIALHIVAGDSVSSAIRTVVDDMSGVTVDELSVVLDGLDDGDGLASSLTVAGRTTAHKDGRRLYDLLGHAHESGGRLATMLAELAVDLRAGIERDLSAEGGKRAVASYGPILALMVPTALLFLLYPTLLGLRELSGTH
ncbi:MAG: type II secretion system F family protein [Actinomycetota bacterium]|nr:type II secretion system F family protein [Actinomycetota bacterium]